MTGSLVLVFSDRDADSIGQVLRHVRVVPLHPGRRDIRPRSGQYGRGVLTGLIRSIPGDAGCVSTAPAPVSFRRVRAGFRIRFIRHGV
ncbi:MAG: hypothetical protein OXI10_15640, partial [Gammaproteobacteria bacterium]|nr:hypothetical protein [Gammaproteobacteria bacterium]